MGRVYNNIRSKKGLLHGYPHKLGRVAQAIEHLSPEQIDWLLRSTPEDMTVAQAIGGIIIDAYFEEQDRS
jgi:hypothetical protein